MLREFFHRLNKEIGYLKMSEWSLQDVATFWDNVFGYEDINKETYSYFRRFIDSYRLSTPLPSESNFLDICCRTGNGTLFFWKKGRIKKAYCVDVSSLMLEICRKKLSDEKVDFETRAIHDDALPLNDGQFDVVLCLETVEHISKAEFFIRELGRVTKSGGQMILSTPNVLWEPVHSLAAILNIHHSEGPHRFLAREKLLSYIHDAGFKVIREDATVLVPAGPSFLVRFGEWLEQNIGKTLRRTLALRRIFICQKK